jgi:hypothetical protein
MSPSIDIDEGVLDLLKHEAEPFVDTPNTVLRRLLGLDVNRADPAASVPAPAAIAQSARDPKRSRRQKGASNSRRAARGSLLSESEYELPILRYLVEHGGRAPSREIVDAIGEVLNDRFTDADRQPLNSGEIRWKSRAAFVRLRLVEARDLDGTAPRGTWQITDEGRARARADT